MSSPATCRHLQCRRTALRVLDGRPYCAVHAPRAPRPVAVAPPPAGGKPVCAYAGCTFLAVELVSGRYSCRTHVTHYARIARAVVETQRLNDDQQRDYQRLAVQAKKIAARADLLELLSDAGVDDWCWTEEQFEARRIQETVAFERLEADVAAQQARQAAARAADGVG